MATIAEALQIAIQHYQTGRLQLAEQNCRQIVAVEPNQPQAWHLLGVASAQLGKHQVESSASLAPDAATGLARSAQQLGQPVAGPRQARRGGRLPPAGPGAEAGLCRSAQQPGHALKDQGRLDEAVAAYRRALELKPDFAEAHNNLGGVLRCQGSFEAAVACYRRAVQLRPGYAEAHHNLAIALQDQGKPDEAAAACRRGWSSSRTTRGRTTAWALCWGSRAAWMKRPPPTAGQSH